MREGRGKLETVARNSQTDVHSFHAGRGSEGHLSWYAANCVFHFKCTALEGRDLFPGCIEGPLFTANPINLFAIVTPSRHPNRPMTSRHLFEFQSRVCFDTAAVMMAIFCGCTRSTNMADGNIVCRTMVLGRQILKNKMHQTKSGTDAPV